MYGNVFYFAHINAIGGIETMFWMLARKYADRDITILYRTADRAQLRRLRELVRVRKWDGERVRCRKLFCNYTADILDYAEAEEYSLILHADYRASVYAGMAPPVYPKVTRYFAVSQRVAESFEALTGITPEVCYNPFIADRPRRVLRLVSATRR